MRKVVAKGSGLESGYRIFAGGIHCGTIYHSVALPDQKRDRLVFDEDVIKAMADEVEEAATAFDTRREALAKCMKKLDQRQRGLLHDHYTVSQSLREIAKASGRSLSAVKMSLLRIRQQLSACIEREIRTNP